MVILVNLGKLSGKRRIMKRPAYIRWWNMRIGGTLEWEWSAWLITIRDRMLVFHSDITIIRGDINYLFWWCKNYLYLDTQFLTCNTSLSLGQRVHERTRYIVSIYIERLTGARRDLLMIVSILDTVNSGKNANLYTLTWYQSSCQLRDYLPFSTRKIPIESPARCPTLSVVCLLSGQQNFMASG